MLLVWSPVKQRQAIEILKLSCPIIIDNLTVEYSDEAEHVGVLWSVTGGNKSHIIDRISAHRRAMASFLSSGAALHHRASPRSTMQLEKLPCAALWSAILGTNQQGGWRPT